MKERNIFLFFIIFLFVSSGVSFGQEFGFGSDDNDSTENKISASGSGKEFSIKIGGEIAVELTPYLHDSGKEGRQELSFWDMVSRTLNLTLSSPNAEAYAAFKLSYDTISELWDYDWSNASRTPLLIDEAFLRAYIGPINVEAGFRKLTWGKADSLGPLDVTNPLDYTDLRNISDIKSIKIARPMLHLTWNTGNFSKLEAVFIPNFAGHRFAQEGRWQPLQYSTMPDMAMAGILNRAYEKFPGNELLINSMFQTAASGFSDSLNPSFPNTSTLDYFQTGLRYTTTIGPVDIGAQYYYGNLFLPNFNIDGVDVFFDDIMKQVVDNLGDPSKVNPNINLLNPQIKYNRYHQIGIDYAQVVFGFNLRAEFAVHLTEDLKGTDGSVRNPFLGWSLGFDRELPWGIYVNLQCNETIRLLDNKVGKNPVMDAEAGTDVTSTRVTAQVSKKFLRDNLETKVTAIWDIESSGCYVIPAVVWTMGGLSSELSAGVFTGKEDGDLGQYWENSFIRVGLKYSF